MSTETPVTPSNVEKMSLASADVLAERLEALKELFPETVVEGKVDLERLRQHLGDFTHVGAERYGLNWAGKSEALRTLQQQSYATLLPMREESMNFDTSENLIIEGDNLEVLKLLQKSYHGRIKMIYIDPPYNTGGDFVYPDNFSEGLETYLRFSGQADEEGLKLSTNTESGGRYHSNWLNMMYSRLFMAKSLLAEDGVIFVNIGEEEFANLTLVMNEIFGADNCLSSIARVAKTASNKGTFFAPSIDFILCYSRNKFELDAFSQNVDETLYKKTEMVGARKGEKYRDDIALYQSSLDITRGSYNQRYFIECPDGSRVVPPGKTLPPEKGVAGDGVWRWKPETLESNKHLLVFKETTRSPLLDQNGNQAKYNIYTKSYLKDREEKGTLPRNYMEGFINRKGADLIKKYGIEFSYSKPVELIEYLMDICNLGDEDTILDFFAGSFTTAHAVLRTNLHKQKNRKFIMVQLPEPNDNQEQISQGLETIFEIGAERVRRVIKEIQETNSLIAQDNLGFKAFKLTSSNFKLWNPEDTPTDAQALAKQLELFVHNVLPGRTPEAILYEVILKAGFPLTAPIEAMEIAGQTVYAVGGGALLVCLADPIAEPTLRGMLDLKPAKMVALDIAFHGNDQLKTNIKLQAEQTGDNDGSRVQFVTV